MRIELTTKQLCFIDNRSAVLMSISFFVCFNARSIEMVGKSTMHETKAVIEGKEPLTKEEKVEKKEALQRNVCSGGNLSAVRQRRAW